ncbi:MAG: DUF3592 domain-containing protein [Porphyrobacter sp.]|nr:DUF3592 domain-containing protein [Porphyrobacter sp.]
MNKVGMIIAALFLLAGLGCLGAAWDQVDTDHALAAKGARAEGTVVELGRFRITKGRIRYRSIIEFPDQAGNRQRFTSAAATRSPGHHIGQRVPVIFDPANPADAVIDSFSERRLASLIYGFLGSAFTLLGGAVLFGALWGRDKVLKRDKFGRRLRRD